ncbi:hypothetical protein CANCADRAFT_30219 [Tortispora caseinolytica NRRL Y-17796]|uniref:V-type proton ATPase subunit E n=1 Tax=Tortispora caseinolytica NRRL Y-17796 TaxID=767744 RepID=A0A1E4TJK7_9ASCO|nr:hypothetical protein CANCADRAFT_30219 [Tortispora caseinolytica NRRL Y-17796]
MERFIKQEALEKAREIQIKADEDFAIEKAQIVRQETAAIDEAFEARTKQAELDQQIKKSNISNKIRLQVLDARQAVVSEIFDKALAKATEAIKTKSTYQTVLEGLITEGLFALMEPKVAVRVKECDVDVAKAALPAAAENYKKETGSDVELSIDTQYLPSTSHGGVVIVGGNGRIEVTNTIEERLKILSEDSLPTIRATIFGASATRKFFD